MKRILLTLASAVIGLSALAQQQDNTGTETKERQRTSSDTTQLQYMDNQDAMSGQDTTGNSEVRQQDMRQDDRSSSMRQDDQASTDNSIEVVKDKEGPNNEVVYKYQGKMFYVDREQEKLIEVSESDLRNSEHDVIVKEPAGTQQDNARTRERENTSG